MNLLIVDDIPLNRELLRVILEGHGHCIMEAADGVEALAVLADQPVDAVLSDILMPNMDGFRLCHEIRQSEKLRRLPFIVFTSTYTSTEDQILAGTVGADKYLAKPATTAAILAALRDACQARQGPPPALETGREEAYVLKQYSQALVNKLEEKNAALHQTLEALQRAHDRIIELNAGLEERVRERTEELTKALAEVKELEGILPICSYCRKMRDDTNFWMSVDQYLASHTKAQLSHCICPECFETVVKPEMLAFAEASANAPE
jgi:CheY-like chemotaxis protein